MKLIWLLGGVMVVSFLLAWLMGPADSGFGLPPNPLNDIRRRLRAIEEQIAILIEEARK